MWVLFGFPIACSQHGGGGGHRPLSFTLGFGPTKLVACGTLSGSSGSLVMWSSIIVRIQPAGIVGIGLSQSTDNIIVLHLAT